MLTPAQAADLASAGASATLPSGPSRRVPAIRSPVDRLGGVVQHKIASVLGEFARTVSTDFDIQGILDHLVERIVDVLPITAAGVVVITPGEEPVYVAASDESVMRFELLQTELGEGPCVLSYNTGEAVLVPDLAADTRFRNFGTQAVSAGFAAVFAFPLRSGDHRLGALELYRDEVGELREDEVSAAVTLASVTAAYLLNARARSEMQASESRYRSIVETAEEGIWIQDLAGGTTFANPKMAQLLATTVEDLGSRPFIDFVHLYDRPVAKARLASHPHGDAEQYRFAFRRADGSTCDVLIAASPLRDSQGDLVGVLNMVTDISARVSAEAENARLESQRQQGERLASLGQLAGGIAHDFNNLLGVISNYATLIDHQSDDVQVRADAGEITVATERAAALTRQLLAFAHQDRAEAKPVDINQLIRHFGQLLHRTIGEQIEVRLLLEERPGTSITAVVDPNQLEEVLLNLAINSRDAMPLGGVLTLATDLVTHIGASRLPTQSVRIQVSDTGEGMSATVAGHAFEPFFTTKPRGAGTGLGLATAYGVVGQNHGEISISSLPGEGTTITLIFPTADVNLETPQVRPAPPRGGRESILLVEDEDALRHATTRILTRSGYHVVSVTDGDEALELFDSDNALPDIVITDMVMKRMSGSALGRELGRRYPRLPVIYMSGYATATSEPLPASVLKKPVSEQILLDTVREALDSLLEAPAPR